MRILFLLLFFASPAVWACSESLIVNLEDGKPHTFCKLEKLLVSESCFNQKQNCELLKDYKKNKANIEKSDPISKARTQNPGSFICSHLKWKVLVGKMYEGSHVCVCEHPSKMNVICTSMLP